MVTSKWPKQITEMDCIECLEALREWLKAMNLPQYRLLETFIDRAEEAYHEKGV